MKRKEEIMCPVCLTSMALVVAGATSTGGLTALVAKKLSRKGRHSKAGRSKLTANNDQQMSPWAHFHDERSNKR